MLLMRFENQLGVVSMEGTPLAQSCVSPKTLEMNFQFWKEEKVENKLGEVSMEGAALAQSCVSPETIEMNFHFRKGWKWARCGEYGRCCFCTIPCFTKNCSREFSVSKKRKGWKWTRCGKYRGCCTCTIPCLTTKLLRWIFTLEKKKRLKMR